MSSDYPAYNASELAEAVNAQLLTRDEARAIYTSQFNTDILSAAERLARVRAALEETDA